MLYQSELPLLVWRLYHEAWYCSGGQLVRRHVPGMCGALHRVARTQARVEYPGLWKRRRSMAFWVATRAVETAPRGAPLQHTHATQESHCGKFFSGLLIPRRLAGSTRPGPRARCFCVCDSTGVTRLGVRKNTLVVCPCWFSRTSRRRPATSVHRGLVKTGNTTAAAPHDAPP